MLMESLMSIAESIVSLKNEIDPQIDLSAAGKLFKSIPFEGCQIC